jgi:hypothetical protein
VTAPRSPYAAVTNPPAEETLGRASDIEQTQFPANTAGAEPPPIPKIPDLAEESQDPVISGPSRPQTELKAKPVEDPPLVAALRCYLNRKPDEAVIWLERYDRTNQDLLLCLLPLVARLTEGSLQKIDPKDLTHLLAELNQVVALMQPAAQMVIDKMCFISKGRNFGVYDKLDEEYEFQPGGLLFVYVELQNFSSERDERTGRFRIRLKSEMFVQDIKGNVVDGKNFEVSEDLSETRRHDFYINYPLRLRRDLPAGSYILRLNVTDVPTKRNVERTLDFHVITARGRGPWEPGQARESQHPARVGGI